MMASFMSYFGGRRDPKQASRDAIITLREQLQMIEKKQEYLQKKIDQETRTARDYAVTNRQCKSAHRRAECSFGSFSNLDAEKAMLCSVL